MPELPEVETTRRGIAPHLRGERITRLIVRQNKLRWPVPDTLSQTLVGKKIEDISRRGKYLLFHTDAGVLISHLGMSGSLRICEDTVPVRKHDHIDIVFTNQTVLRYHDPRRFGCMLWTDGQPDQHRLIAPLGLEPLDTPDLGVQLHRLSRGRQVTVKSFIMNAHIVVGIGNIYANEALFLSKIHPATPVGKIGIKRYRRLAASIEHVLKQAISQGGTTLKDFVNSRGSPGYFAQQLQVYGRRGKACRRCQQPIQRIVINKRASDYCPKCQRK